MSSISTHVLDLVRGGPAQGVPISLEHLGEDGGWHELANGFTDGDGRIKDLAPRGGDLHGTFRITFDTGVYFARIGAANFYPYVPVVFHIPSIGEHYHVPLLLGPYGYSTYRGS